MTAVQKNCRWDLLDERSSNQLPSPEIWTDRAGSACAQGHEWLWEEPLSTVDWRGVSDLKRDVIDAESRRVYTVTVKLGDHAEAGEMAALIRQR